jgi:[acyl-carrier-protein] S-malonyltransferase
VRQGSAEGRRPTDAPIIFIIRIIVYNLFSFPESYPVPIPYDPVYYGSGQTLTGAYMCGTVPSVKEKPMKTCFLFPGQGAQYPGMGKDLWEESPKVKELFDIASDTAKLDVKKLLFEGSEDELRVTDKTQVAVTLVNLSVSAVLREKGLVADGCAGFSLGEYSALCEAGIIALEDIFPLVKARGEFMERASRALDTPTGKAGMTAVVGCEYAKAVEILSGLKRDDVFLSNHTSPTQVVLGGTAQGLANAEDAFDAAGFRRLVPLKVSGPFHTPLIKQAQDDLRGLLDQYTFRDPVKAVYANATGERITSGARAKELCVTQVISTVRWVAEEENILKDGFDRFIETGPGTVLKGLWKGFNTQYVCASAGKLEEIKKLLEGK